METNELINRINELAEKAYSENRFLFTDFLDMSQLSSFYGIEKDLAYVGTAVSGGTEGCERCIVRFGSPDNLGYDESFPIALLYICPIQKKFSDTLTHRDFLGSVIGLGIERTKLGDIIVRDNEGYFFVADSISEYIIDKHNMEGLKPPFLVLGTHHSFTDFYVTPLCLAPYRANYISELEGFENYGEWIYRQVGCLGTRKFINDQALIKNIRRVIKRKGIMVIYPEARYANVGTPSELPRSVAKLVRLLKVPVVIVNMQGNYLLSPIWNLKERKSVRLHADVTCVLSADDAKTKSVEEIHQILTEGLDYDEYKYQRDNNMVIADDFRAEGLHMPLYQCISCKTEFKMITKGSTIKCEACGAEYEMDELGTLHKKGSEDSLYIPDWYDWERQRVNEEIDAGEYLLDTRVRIEALPNSFNFVDCGEGRLVHSEDGFDLTYYNYRTDQMETLHFAPKSTISIHTEYDYRGKGQCVTLSTMDDTFFIYPLEDGFNATKIQFATEYLAKK